MKPPIRSLPPEEKALAKRAARLAAPVFESEGWPYAPHGTVPSEKELERVVKELLGYNAEEALTGRFVVVRENGKTTVLLELGTSFGGSE